MNRREFVKSVSAAAGVAASGGVFSRAAGDASGQAPSGTGPGAGGLLTGTFMFLVHPNPWNAAYCDNTIFWAEENWRALITDIHRLGMDTAIWVGTAFWGRPLFPGYRDTVGIPFRMGCPDPMAVVADEADRLGMKLFYGIGFRGRACQVRDYARLDKPWPDVWFDWNTAQAEALVDRYGSRPSFAGLYIGYEIDYHAHHVELYEKLVREHLRPAVGSVKLLASPGNLGVEVPDLEQFPKDVERTNIDILAPQDYGGRSHDVAAAIDLVRRNADALERVGPRLRDMGVSLWANCELFVHEGSPDGRGMWNAGPIERVRQQIDLQSPVADKLICFIYGGAMNRHTGLVDIGHSSTDTLYQGYTSLLAERFPGRFDFA
ncbi:MAG: DUF4434 domain-containing protein [Candidatus Hydrogenedentes bacterium]|nr:DUF4434 domain-containing protein [Candidatus Hydrogenedentota bacterium]